MEKEVTVIGAGIQGSCIALELANRGYTVDLLDQDSKPFNRSSMRNEGKIHLGLVYMNDEGFKTPPLLLKGALRFSKNLERWIGSSVYDLNISTPFWYLVSNDSFLNPSELEKGYHRLQKHYDEIKNADGRKLDYLGTYPDQLTKKTTEAELAEFFKIRQLHGGFKTCELAVDTIKLAKYIRRAIKNHPKVTFLRNMKVHGISKNGNGYIIDSEHRSTVRKRRSQQVVNATWTDKYKLDKTLGIIPPSDILYRLKYRVIADIPEEMKKNPSATMVIGKFGDVVIRPDNTAYISWYPDACRGWSNSIEPPESWSEPSRGKVSKSDFNNIAEKLINETAKWYPEIRKCVPKIVDAGIIVAHGKSDVDDENSRLHQRSEIGVTSYEGYHSVETGKLTTAPLFAMDTADSVDRVFHQY